MTFSAICTGGGSGIGRATALALAARGGDVMVGDVDADGAAETVRLIEEAGGRGAWQEVDVADAEQVDRFVAAGVDADGRLDCAANVAGTHAGLGALTADVSEEEFDRQLAVNLRGMWLCVRAELRAMLDAGGSIVNVSSVNGLTAASHGAPYSIAKHGILGLTRTAAAEYARAGIRVNAVCPGLIDTPLTARAWQLMDPAEAEGERAQILSEIPAGRMGGPEEIGDSIAWLCRDAPGYLTGATIVVDGGLTIRG